MAGTRMLRDVCTVVVEVFPSQDIDSFYSFVARFFNPAGKRIDLGTSLECLT